MDQLQKILAYKDRDEFLKTWYRERPYLTTAHLKYIAMLAMLLSHISQTGYLYMFGEKFYEIAGTFTLIGRIAMPIYCFFTVQAVVFTKDIKKYFARMLLFALVSEVPFNLAFAGETFNLYYQNVIFTLLIGAITIYVMDLIWKSEQNMILKIIIMAIVAFLGCALADILMTDYGAKGVFAIIAIYLCKNNKIATAIAMIIAFYFEFYMPGGFTGMTYGFVYLSIPLIMLYNAQRGKQNKWAFYIFYPAHLLLIYGLMMVQMNSLM